MYGLGRDSKRIYARYVSTDTERVYLAHETESPSYSVVDADSAICEGTDSGVEHDNYGAPQSDGESDRESNDKKKKQSDNYALGVSDNDDDNDNDSAAPDNYGLQSSGTDNEASEVQRPVAPAAVVNNATQRSWMAEFQSDAEEFGRGLVEVGSGSREQVLRQMSELFSDFEQTATLAARTIVSEMFLDDTVKTIKPVSIGGVAGGAKYLYAGILFKFATDVEVAPGSFLYGGIGPDYASANKSAGHELKSLNALINASLDLGISVFSFPLMCIIDFRGRRIVAVCMVPVKKKTLVIGSNDGHTCVNGDPAAYYQLRQLCSSLGLLEHSVNGVSVCGPGDLEVHRSEEDHCLYMLDFARLFPPDVPNKPSRSIFFQLLRPEFAQIYARQKEALCSDAFSGWGKGDPNWKQHNEAVTRASQFLRQEQVVRLAAVLDDHFTKLCNESEFSHSVLLTQFNMLSVLAHEYGINVRLLGLTRTAMRNEVGRALLLSHLVYRTLKNLARDRLRKLHAQLRVQFESPFKNAFLDIVHMLRGCHPHSRAFFVSELPGLVESKFGKIDFLENDLKHGTFSASEADLSLRLIFCPLEERLLSSVGYQWRHGLSSFEGFAAGQRWSQLENYIHGGYRRPLEPVSAADLSLEMRPVFKTTGLADWCDAKSQLLLGLRLAENCLIDGCLRALKRAKTSFGLARFSVTSNPSLLVEIAYISHLEARVFALPQDKSLVIPKDCRNSLNVAWRVMTNPPLRSKCVYITCLTPVNEYSLYSAEPFEKLKPILESALTEDYGDVFDNLQSLMLTPFLARARFSWLCVLLGMDEMLQSPDQRTDYLALLLPLIMGYATPEILDKSFSWVGVKDVGREEQLVVEYEMVMARYLATLFNEGLKIEKVANLLRRVYLELSNKRRTMCFRLVTSWAPLARKYELNVEDRTLRVVGDADVASWEPLRSFCLWMARAIHLPDFISESCGVRQMVMFYEFDIMPEPHKLDASLRARFGSSGIPWWLLSPVPRNTITSFAHASDSWSSCVLPTFLADFASLTELSLNMESLNVVAEDFAQIMNVKNLRRLKLLRCAFENPEPSVVPEGGDSTPSPTAAAAVASLSLPDVLTNENVLQKILTRFVNQLESLHIEYCNFGPSFDSCSIPVLPKLTSFHFDHPREIGSAAPMLSVLLQAPCLETLWVQLKWDQALEVSPSVSDSLVELTLRECSPRLAEALFRRPWKSLQRITFLGVTSAAFVLDWALFPSLEEAFFPQRADFSLQSWSGGRTLKTLSCGRPELLEGQTQLQSLTLWHAQSLPQNWASQSSATLQSVALLQSRLPNDCFALASLYSLVRLTSVRLDGDIGSDTDKQISLLISNCASLRQLSLANMPKVSEDAFLCSRYAEPDAETLRFLTNFAQLEQLTLTGLMRFRIDSFLDFCASFKVLKLQRISIYAVVCSNGASFLARMQILKKFSGLDIQWG